AAREQKAPSQSPPRMPSARGCALLPRSSQSVRRSGTMPGTNPLREAGLPSHRAPGTAESAAETTAVVNSTAIRHSFSGCCPFGIFGFGNRVTIPRTHLRSWFMDGRALSVACHSTNRPSGSCGTALTTARERGADVLDLQDFAGYPQAGITGVL